jgi:hypothetical protein
MRSHCNCDRDGLEPFDASTDHQTRLGGLVGRILVAEKKSRIDSNESESEERSQTQKLL